MYKEKHNDVYFVNGFTAKVATRQDASPTAGFPGGRRHERPAERAVTPPGEGDVPSAGSQALAALGRPCVHVTRRSAPSLGSGRVKAVGFALLADSCPESMSPYVSSNSLQRLVTDSCICRINSH